jgi:hypothetical protein
VEINKQNIHLRKFLIQVRQKRRISLEYSMINLGDEMTRLEELEEQSRHLMDKVRTKRRKVEDIKNDLKVKNSSKIIFN